MTDLDTLLRDTFELVADRAPAPEPVRARLDAALRGTARPPRRNPRLVPALGAAVATVGVVAGVGLFGLPDVGGSAAPAATTTSSPVPAPAPVGSTSASGFFSVPLRYSPTGLPKTLREIARSGGPANLNRTWKPGTAPATDAGGDPRLDFEIRTGGPTPTEGTAATVAGRPARLVDGGDKTLVQWELAPGVHGTLLSIGLGLDGQDLLRLAAAVRPDDGTATFPLAADLPAGATWTGFEEVVGGPDRWSLTLSADSAQVRVGPPVSSVPDAPPVDVSRLTVDGRPATYQPVAENHPAAELVITLGGGRVLSVAVSQQGPTIPTTQESLVRIARSVRWQPPTLG